MKLSTRARYALQTMIAITRMTDGKRPVSVSRIAEKTRLSRRYLEQLAVTLKNNTLLRSISGRGGGYLLARKPEEIKIGQIIEAAIGPISIVECVKYPDACLQSDLCECRLLYRLINSRIEDAFNEYSLADMADGNNWRERIEKQMGVDSMLFEAAAGEGRGDDACKM